MPTVVPCTTSLTEPGATAASRRYPIEHYAAALQRLSQSDDRQMLITGGPDEIALVQALALQVPGATALADALRIGELGCVIARAALLISNNTGPAHIAAALGTPVVDLYALTNPQHPPWQVPNRVLSHDVPCRYCYRSACVEGHHACLRGVPPDRVAEAALDLVYAPAVTPFLAAALRSGAAPTPSSSLLRPAADGAAGGDDPAVLGFDEFDASRIGECLLGGVDDL